MIEAAVDAERCSRDSDRGADDEFRRDVAPDGCPIDCIIVPYNGINELVEASQPSPRHVEAGSGIPR